MALVGVRVGWCSWGCGGGGGSVGGGGVSKLFCGCLKRKFLLIKNRGGINRNCKQTNNKKFSTNAHFLP